MMTREMLVELFDMHLQALATENRLTESEQARIAAVFRQALANPFMDEDKIYQKLVREEAA